MNPSSVKKIRHIYVLCEFIHEHGQNKTNELNQYLAEKKDHVMQPPA